MVEYITNEGYYDYYYMCNAAKTTAQREDYYIIYIFNHLTDSVNWSKMILSVNG